MNIAQFPWNDLEITSRKSFGMRIFVIRSNIFNVREHSTAWAPTIHVYIAIEIRSLASFFGKEEKIWVIIWEPETNERHHVISWSSKLSIYCHFGFTQQHVKRLWVNHTRDTLSKLPKMYAIASCRPKIKSSLRPKPSIEMLSIEKIVERYKEKRRRNNDVSCKVANRMLRTKEMCHWIRWGCFFWIERSDTENGEYTFKVNR